MAMEELNLIPGAQQQGRSRSADESDTTDDEGVLRGMESREILF